MNEMTPLKAAENLENEIKNFDMSMPISAEECIRRDTMRFVASILRRVASGELAEVVHAHWIEMDDDCSNLWKCSHCGLVWEMSNDDTPQENEMFQCPTCGALLGKGDSHEAD
jgi:rubrerythrin